MTRLAVHLHGAAYVLGEEALDHRDIPDLEDRAAELGIPVDPALWGWGSVHRADREVTDLAVSSAATTLADVDPGTVDAALLCCTRFAGDAHTHGDLVSGVALRLGLDRVPWFGVTLNRCANLMAGVHLAIALVRSGAHRRVLVVTADRIEPPRSRVESFALFSDGAASVLVSAERPAAGGHRVLGAGAAQDAAGLPWSEQIRPDLARRLNEELLTPHGLAAGDLDGLLHQNIVLPVLVMKERQAGFRTEHLWTDNVPRIGHCFAADPLINLVDRARQGELRPGGRYLMAAAVPGSRWAALLEPLP